MEARFFATIEHHVLLLAAFLAKICNFFKNVYIVRTAYAKGFNKESSTLDELIEYYNESNPDVVSIQMRNYCEKKGKEKVFLFLSRCFDYC